MKKTAGRKKCLALFSGLAAIFAVFFALTRLAAQANAPSSPPSPRNSPPLPADPLAAQVYRVLESRCARCHQRGALDGAAPAGLLGGILDLDALARTPHLVQAGNPDGSRLFGYLLDRAHPRSSKKPPDVAAPLDAASIAAAHAWIAGLADPLAPCAGRAPLGWRDIETAIEKWLKIFGRETAKDTRFITLAHMRNECASDDDLLASRAAVDKALNSLSSGKTPARTRAIDGTGVILAVRLSALGWDAARWDALSSAQPAGAMPAVPPPPGQTAKAPPPLVRADWLARAATRPSFYNSALKIPEQLADLERMLGVARNAVAAGPQAKRNVERHQTRNGPAWFWREDHAGTPDKDEAPKAAGTRVVFSLPNGLPATVLFDPDGRRRDDAPVDLDAPISGNLAGVLSENAFQYRSALIRASVDPDMTLRGLELVQGLARHWSEDVGFGRASAEAGLPPAELARLLESLPEAYRRSAVRLRQGLIPRAEAAVLMARALGAYEGDASFGELDDERAGRAPEDHVQIWLTSDKADYKIGDSPLFEIETNAPCHLTFVAVNQRGFATVLFPNDFDRDDKIPAGPPLRVPGPSRYALRFDEAGRETFVAICETEPKLRARVNHRYALQRFTSLGDWRSFLSTGRAPASQKARGRRRGREAGETSVQDSGGAALTGRAAIVIGIRE